MRITLLSMVLILVSACAGDAATGVNPDTSAVVAVDRFSDSFAHLFARSKNSTLPAANAPIDFDEAPFITRGLGPSGKPVIYYNFDVLSTTPDPIYVLFRAGEAAPVAGQLNIIDTIPGDVGYNDFWNVVKVTVPAGYVANTATSYAELTAAAYPLEFTDTIVNCPVVPAGSTATLRYSAAEAATLTRGWYKGQVVNYFNFAERALVADATGRVPLSDIYVLFNQNPEDGNPASGPASGFRTESGSEQTHNVLETLPEDSGYSPLWSVSVLDGADFGAVKNLATASAATLFAAGVATVNCPVVAAMK